MRSYKRKEYILILILLYTSVTLCNPCVNQTLNAIPNPNDCQTFILCWLSHAYLQTCPNGLFFDIKTNNCQPLVTATCCNMTLPILIIPVPIYQVSTPPINKTNTWPTTYTTTQQTNSNRTTPLLPTLKPNSTFITSRNQPEATISIMSTLWTKSSDSSQSSELTLHITERTEITKGLEPTSIDMDVTESTKSENSSQINIYTTSSITSSTDFYNKKPNSTLIGSTDISETTTPIQSTLWISKNTTGQTEIVITTPQTSTYVLELTKSEEPQQTETHTYVPTSPAFVTSTESSNKIPTSTLMTPTNPSQLTMPIIFTLWGDSIDSSETSSTTDNLNITEKIVLSTTPLETSSITTTKFIKPSQPNVYTNPTFVSSTDSNINNPSTMASNRPEATTSIISTLWTDLIDTNQSYFTPGFNLNVTDSTKTTSLYNNLTKSKSNTTLLIPQIPSKTTISIISTSWPQLNDSNQSFSSSGHSFTVTEQKETETTILLETNSVDINITKPVESSKANVYSTSPIVPTEYSNYTRLPTTSTTHLLSIATSNSTLNPSNTEIYASAMNTITADTTISSKTFPTITSNSFGPDPQTFTESSTWQPSFSSTINIPSSLNSSFFSTIYSTTELDGAPEKSQYYINKTFTTSLPTLTEHTQTSIKMVMPTFSTDFAENNEYIIQENLSTPAPSDQYSPPEFKIDTINSLTSSTKLSSNTFSTITAKSQISTESSTLLPLVSSTTNILPSTKIPYFPMITPTTELGEPSTITQYSVGNTSTKPSSYFNEAMTQGRVLKTATEYIPTSIPSSPSQFETTNINFILSSMTISSNVSPTVTTDALQTEPQMFSGNSTLIPIFSSTTTTNKQNSSHLTLSSTTEVDKLSIIPQHTEKSSSAEFLSSTQDFFSTLETFSKTKLFTTTEHKLTAVTSQSSPSQLTSRTNTPKSETTVALSSSSESTEATNDISIAPEITFVPFLTPVHSSSPIIFTNTTNSTWDPVSVTLSSSPSNLKSTTDYTTTIPVTTVSISYPSELNVSNNPHLTSTLSTLLMLQPKITETTKYDVESPSTTLETFPTTTENKHRSAVTMEPSISNHQNNMQTDSETYKDQSTVPEEFKSTHSLLSPNIMLFTGKSISSPPDTPTAKPIVTQTRTLPPLPYSPPPCALATTTQKSIISIKTLPTIQPVVTSTYISPITSTHPSLSKPVCGLWDKFVFPDGNDCKYYYKCSFGGITKVSCRYGYEFNPYALKCMPHLEANCQRRKSSKEVFDFLYYVMKLNDLSASSPTEHWENHLDSGQQTEYDETK